jgi:hypothetical protein
LLGLAALSLVLAACGSATITFTRSTPQTFPAKPADCPLEVYSVVPQRPFVEIGTFDIEAMDQLSAITTAAELRRKLGPRACQVGADALVGELGRNGYQRAIALTWSEAPGSPPRAAEGAPGAPD